MASRAATVRLFSCRSTLRASCRRSSSSGFAVRLDPVRASAGLGWPRAWLLELRYPSDVTDEEWALVEPLIPPAKRGGNRRHVVVREVINGLMYILSTGCQWRAIPTDLPPRSTLYDYFDLWSWDGTLDRIHDALYAQCREAASREASPTAAIIDSQSVKSAEKGACD